MIDFYREAVFEDLPQIVKIYNTTVATGISTADTTEVSVESRHAWFYAHTRERPILVKEYHGKIIAWVSFQPFYGRPAYDQTAEISIYLDPNFRGKKLGQQFLAQALEKAPEFAIKNVLAFIFKDNDASLKLFKKFGFKEWGNLPGIAVIEGQEKDLLILGLKV
ncbi:MAG: N-acetyltransferase family protein [Campylobacterales bacterium]|nr:N-acetyltransferase family protein [Campylobacterales bacterium]